MVKTSNRSRRSIYTWFGRLFLVFCSLEFVLSFVSIPAKFEAGVWYGNSYRERILLQILPSAPKLNTLGYRDGEWTLSKSSKRMSS